MLISALILQALLKAYPNSLENASQQHIQWSDGSEMSLLQPINPDQPENKLDNPSLKDQLMTDSYQTGCPEDFLIFNPKTDPGRIRYEPFFKKMYGSTQQEVESHLTTVYWMPKTFGEQYPLRVTTVNKVHQHLQKISAELDMLLKKQPNLFIFLDQPSASYEWRPIAHTNRLSMHSFGIAIDLNVQYSDYWQWDLQQQNLPITEEAALLNYRNHIPWEIIDIFEKHGFIWGGKWRHYDTMHFEYRPELFL